MDRTRLFLSLTILLSVISAVLLSNPESEIVQDSSDESGNSRSRSAQLQNFKDQRRDPRPSLPVRVLRPFVMGSRIVWREVGLPRPFFSQMANRPAFPANDKTFTISEKPVEASKPLPPLEKDSASKVPEVPKSDEASGLPSPDTEGDEKLKPSVGEGSKVTGDKNGVNAPTGAKNPSGLNPSTRTPPATPGEKVQPNSQNPLPGPIAPPQNVPGNLGNTHTKKISPDSNLFAGMVNDFNFKLMESLNLESNFVVSPLSIFIALAMCYLGSNGNTKAQLEQALGMNENAVHEEHLHQGIKDLMSLVGPESSEYQLLVANGMFMGKSFLPNATFMESIQRYYAAEIKNLDFGDGQGSLKTINDWVAMNTRNMIPKLLNKPPPPSTSLILLNAVYFKGSWKIQFPKSRTYDGGFHSWGGKDKTVSTMLLEGETFPFYRSDELQHAFIKLPYEGDQISMVIALPYSPSHSPMKAVTNQQLCQVLDAMADTHLDVVALPKFRMEYSKFLKRPLAAAGIVDLFKAGVANLSRIQRSSILHVDNVLHKAVVEVNEEGTSAAAATEVKIVPLSLSFSGQSFVASHPFAFYIVHDPSGMVLFHGKVFDLGDKNNNRTPVSQQNAKVRGFGSGRNRPRVRQHGAVNYENAR